jgi:hypothetical protein
LAGPAVTGVPARRATLVTLAAILASLPSALLGQRAPVLQQVKVRHPYYYREM